MTAQTPYVSRPEAEALLDALAEALKSPQTSPTVFQVWGIGGVGKTTLARKVKELHQSTAHVADVVFGRTEGIEEPIPLMRKLYEQLAPHDSWSRDPFWEKYDLYFETVHQLNTEPASGRGVVSDTQVKQVKDLLRLGVDVVGKWVLTGAQEKVAEQVVDRGTDAAVAALSLKDDLQGLLQQHRATKRDQALQRLMLEPLPLLTQAFVEGLRQQTKQKPVVLVLDTYEKAHPDIDTWLWRTLLGNTALSQIAVRLVVTGRYCVLRAEGWRKLQQDTNCLYERTFERFNQEQTRDYLGQIGLTDETEVAQIYQATRGLPYYLNWVREQRLKGNALNFAEGNQAIVRLLVEGLTPNQQQVVQLAAC
ncbi:MAG TPA: hypothetical protein V6D29_16240, partial [Leptolyngbyaceae cyanobacterium]